MKRPVGETPGICCKGCVCVCVLVLVISQVFMKFYVGEHKLSKLSRYVWYSEY